MCCPLSQGVLSRTEQFAVAHEVIRCSLSELQERLAVADVLQPDVPSKKSKAQQLRVRPFSGVGSQILMVRWVAFLGLRRHKNAGLQAKQTQKNSDENKRTENIPSPHQKQH